MSGKFVEVGQTEQGMNQSAIPHVHFWRLHQPLLHIREMRRKPPHKQQVREQIDITADGRRCNSQASRQLRSVQQRSLAVGEHGPKPLQRLGRNANAELWNITLKIGSNEVLTIRETVAFAVRQKTVGKAAS